MTPPSDDRCTLTPAQATCRDLRGIAGELERIRKGLTAAGIHTVDAGLQRAAREILTVAATLSPPVAVGRISC